MSVTDFNTNPHYFKWVALREENPDWYEQELRSRRARFGWSSPGSDLDRVRRKWTRVVGQTGRPRKSKRGGQEVISSNILNLEAG